MAGPDHHAVQVRRGALRVGSGDGETRTDRRDGEVEVALSGEKVAGEYRVTPSCESIRSEQMGDAVIN